MANDWATRFTAEALAKVEGFIADHPEYTREGVAQPGQGATNRVHFVRRGETIFVIKVFCEEERKERECFGLRHWAGTGLVPEVLWDDDPRMIVMSHVPGTGLHVSRTTDGEAAWREASVQAGRAIGALTRVPLGEGDRAGFESRFYKGVATLEEYLGRIVDLGWGIHQRDPDFRDGFWRRSLEFVEAELPGIFSQERVLYHQDVGNMHVRQGRFEGFFDLEMCRVGCATMQLGSAMSMLHKGDMPWECFGRGVGGGDGAIAGARRAEGGCGGASFAAVAGDQPVPESTTGRRGRGLRGAGRLTRAAAATRSKEQGPCLGYRLSPKFWTR